GMNTPYRGGGQPNWSGSNWGHPESQWGGSHSGRFIGSDTDMRGRTPKGYTRSDDRIKDDVCEQLYRTPDIDVSEVTVEARNGTVTLEGTVPDRRMKHRIEDLCEQCIGVQDVENRIRVSRENRNLGSRFGTDEEIRSSTGGLSGTADKSNKTSTGTSSSQH
ncbi:MAG: BON domain-containing protein, partial [Panacagrimonas sp.]